MTRILVSALMDLVVMNAKKRAADEVLPAQSVRVIGKEWFLWETHRHDRAVGVSDHTLGGAAE